MFKVVGCRERVSRMRTRARHSSYDPADIRKDVGCGPISMHCGCMIRGDVCLVVFFSQ